MPRLQTRLDRIVCLKKTVARAWCVCCYYTLQQFSRFFVHSLRWHQIGRNEIGESCHVWLAHRLEQIVTDPHVGNSTLFSSPLPQNRSVPPVRGPPAVSRIYFVDVLLHFSISSDFLFIFFASIAALFCKRSVLKCTVHNRNLVTSRVGVNRPHETCSTFSSSNLNSTIHFLQYTKEMSKLNLNPTNK